MVESKHNVSLSQIMAVDDVTGDKNVKDYDVITLEPEDDDAAKNDVVSCNGVPAQAKKVTFVYDLYYGKATDLSRNVVGGDIWKACFGNDLADLMCEDSDVEDISEGDEDSNAEDNWRNEYPDEEESSDEEDFRYSTYQWRSRPETNGYSHEVVSSCSSDNEESSEDEALVYSLNEEQQRERRLHRLDDEADEQVANRHGSAYARFKSKVLRDMEALKVTDECSDSDSDECLDEDDRVALEDGL